MFDPINSQYDTTGYTSTFVNANSIQGVNFNHKVVPEEDKANNWEEVDKDEG